MLAGGSYIVTPTKAALAPTSASINTIDIVAVQRHFLGVVLLPPGCRQTAGDVNSDTAINTIDVVAIQRFFLGLSTGIANTGKYLFAPASRAYPGVATDQTAQDYGALILGDVATPFVHRPEAPSQDGPEQDVSDEAATPAVAVLSLPNVAVDSWVTDFVIPVTTTMISARKNLVGFQGDFTFDENVISFQENPVQKAGLTNGNWNVSGNVLPGDGPIRTLRISAFSLDLTPLSGSGALFELRMKAGHGPSRETLLRWAKPPNNFIFIDTDLNEHKPGSAEPGGVISSAKD